ncbi:putative cytochrome p450 [Rosellinia necatrix]|uniref:Putative cytochrome p450 n=1 Tax=Rosellinia necatrix TaxID=77044 RepID=A0A1W2TN26_ROSNE|nr:putative cytochrome p450 [Rosellinia necatrix]
MENITQTASSLDLGDLGASRGTLIAIVGGILAVYIFNSAISYPFQVEAPVAGKGGLLSFEWLARLTYSFNAREVLYQGYNKYKNSMFNIVRNDSNVIVMNPKYLAEIGNLPDSHSSSSVGQIRNMAGAYSTADIIMKSDLHFRQIQHKLTPNLVATIPMVKHELDDALKVETPDCKGKWTPVPMFEYLSLVVARVTGRVFVGPELCRDPDWIKVSLEYDINVGTAVVTLRMFPPFLHPIIARLLPSWWRAHRDIKTAERIIGPEVRARREKEANDLDYVKPHDLLQWMMDDAVDWETDPENLALRQLVVNLAALHTTSMATTHAVYDLCAYPEYIQPLREEIIEVLRADGGWQRNTLSKLRKLDSFIKETQRWSPASLMSFNRYLRQPYTLEDGTHLPQGTHLCFAAEPILMDESIVPGGRAQAFQPFRFSEAPDDSEHKNRNDLATISTTSLHFGAGRYGCPGRFFAAMVIKLMFAHMLLRYDFKYTDEQKAKGRPKNFAADENIFPDPSIMILMRERTDMEPDVERMLSVGAGLEEWDL